MEGGQEVEGQGVGRGKEEGRTEEGAWGEGFFIHHLLTVLSCRPRVRQAACWDTITLHTLV